MLRFLDASKAAQTAPPEEPPTNKPSSLISLLAMIKESLSLILMYSSTKLLSKTSGKKSYPIPSTLYGYTSFPPPRIEPKGSTPIILIFGNFSFNFFATPVIVPPVPTPATNIDII